MYTPNPRVRVSNSERHAVQESFETGVLCPGSLYPPSPVASGTSERKSAPASDSYHIHIRLNDGQRLPSSPQPLGPPFPPLPPPPENTQPSGVRFLEPWTYGPVPNGIPPVPPLQPPPPGLPSPNTLNLCRSVVKLRDKVISKRHSLRIQRQIYSNQRGHTRKAWAEFRTLAGSSHQKQRAAELNAAFEKLEHSNSLLNTLEAEVQNAENEIDLLEDRLLKREKALYRALSGPEPRIYDHHINDDNLSDLKSDDISSTSSLDSIVSKYYRKASEANRLREELFNFEQEHQRQVYLRDVDQSEGLAVEPSEVSFLRSYFTERRERIEEFSTTKQDAEHLYHECVRTGHQVEKPMVVQYPDIEALDHSNRLSHRIAEAAVTANIGREDVEALIEGQNIQDRVSSWLQGVKRALAPRVDSMDVLASGAPAQPPCARLASRVSPASRAGALCRGRISLPSEHSHSNQPAEPRKPKNKRLSFHGEAVRKRYSDPSFSSPQDDFHLENGGQARRVRSLR